jgi:ankyrin repeat protein
LRHTFLATLSLVLPLVLTAQRGVAADDPAQQLRQAASDGDREVVARALAAGVGVDEASASGGTALMFAAYGDHAELVTVLLAAGAEPDRGDRFGDPAIHWAAYGGAPAAVDALLAGGADPTIVTHHGDALAIAMRRGFPAIVESLVGHTGTGTGDTPLHRAARTGDLAELEQILTDGGAVDAENRIGYTPLMEASREGHADIVARLLAAGADPAHRGNALGMGMTALHLAADRDQADVARALLSHGVPVDVGNAQGTTPLAWGLGEGSLEIADVLLAAGADPAIEDDNDFSALDMVEYLDDEELRGRIVEAAEPAGETTDARPVARDSYISYGGISSLPTRTAWGAFETGCPDPDAIPKGDDVGTVRQRVLACLESGRDRARQVGDPRDELAYETELEWLYHLGHDQREAGARERALALARRIGDGCREALLLFREASHDHRPVSVDERLERFRRALETARESECLVEQALILREMASTLRPREPRSVEMLEEAASLVRQAGDLRWMVVVFSSLSRHYAEVGDPRAIDLRQEIVDIWAQSEDRLGWKIAHWNLGVAYEWLGRVEEAGEHKAVYSGMYADFLE